MPYEAVEALGEQCGRDPRQAVPDLTERPAPGEQVPDDERGPPDIRAVAEVLPNARVALIPGQSHAADAFAPDLVTERILPFLLDADPDP